MANFPSESDVKNLVKELSQGRELAKQLQIHLNPRSSSAHEIREFLLHRILHSYDRALSMLPGNPSAGVEASDSPRSRPGSPHTDDSDQDFKDPASRKRNNKAVPVTRWSENIKVLPEAGIEGQLDDGYAWRKYGQKDILGAKYPRGYYRCTYRHAQGCLATKHVQRSDDDPTIFEITYRRKHTCNPRASTTNNVNNPQNEDPIPPAQNPQNDQPLFDIQTNLRAITTQDLGTNENPSFPVFKFPSSSAIDHPEHNHIFSDGNNILGNYYPISTNEMNDNYEELIPNLHNSESELSPIVAAMTCTTNSPTVGTHVPFGSSGFGSNFRFDNQGYYP